MTPRFIILFYGPCLYLLKKIIYLNHYCLPNTTIIHICVCISNTFQKYLQLLLLSTASLFIVYSDNIFLKSKQLSHQNILKLPLCMVICWYYHIRYIDSFLVLKWLPGCLKASCMWTLKLNSWKFQRPFVITLYFPQHLESVHIWWTFSASCLPKHHNAFLGESLPAYTYIYEFSPNALHCKNALV